MNRVEAVRARVAGLAEPRGLQSTAICGPDPLRLLPERIVATIFSAAC